LAKQQGFGEPLIEHLADYEHGPFTRQEKLALRLAEPRLGEVLFTVIVVPIGLLHGVAPEVDLDEIDPAEPLQEAAELDSMDFLNLVIALYDETGIDVAERDYPLVATIDGFVAYVTAASAKESRRVT